jgi:hypothetical protein
MAVCCNATANAFIAGKITGFQQLSHRRAAQAKLLLPKKLAFITCKKSLQIYGHSWCFAAHCKKSWI